MNFCKAKVQSMQANFTKQADDLLEEKATMFLRFKQFRKIETQSKQHRRETLESFAWSTHLSC